MVIRALGNNLNVSYLRFFKNRSSGKISFLKQSTKLKIENFYESSQKFFWETLIDIFKNKKTHIEIALSCRYASLALEQYTDLISEVKSVKHYFEQGQMEREGIDY